MKKKSKFLTFIFSFVPGLQYLYIGFSGRAGIAMASIIGIIAMTAFIQGMTYSMPFTALFIPVIWLITMIDSMMIVDRINFTVKYGELEEYKFIMKDKKILGFEQEQILSIFFSIMPGAGHMYIGAMNQGVQIMACFLVLLYLSNLTGVMLFLIVAMIIWFYSMFDMVHRVSGSSIYDDGGEFILFTIVRRLTANSNSNKVVGILFVLVGVLIIGNKIIAPVLIKMIGHSIMEVGRMIFISAIFILIGFRLIFKSSTKALTKGEVDR
ncbi:hypothetical protein [Oceanirhabdus sp. W0125-5]|uniref:hypothetical protein n=1 Tax=Oceanirhabdus sp. W0125-5 TaxID=2999116 RepID=UPI0022F30680|nr:hypothetical protein [Oceanirhabdus sp. W0125-5]WBW97455.1 hypothetical protein OW730_00950 [Oceanirhabdus sp. W0125-5]